ncbi:MAG: hypothetical protein FWE82_07635 [Defluviitaleaceae bacterium]|nr:hypothetical protein [Defluviitaleaceae bacterium]
MNVGLKIETKTFLSRDEYCKYINEASGSDMPRDPDILFGRVWEKYF